jgi:hypothetical protein
MSRSARLFGIVGCAMIAGAGLWAANSGPLEATKQELRTLDRQQRPNEGPSATEGLRPNLPAIQSPGRDALPAIQSTDPEKMDKERKRRKDAQKNWLVNGVEQLEKSETQKKSDGSGSTEELEVESARAATDDDPQYLLKLYDEQKKGEDARKAEQSARRTPRSDPIAPFLQDWLGRSPVRGQFFDQFVRNDSTTAGGGNYLSAATHTVTNRDPLAPDLPVERSPTASEPRTNPYLVPSTGPELGEPRQINELLGNSTGPVLQVAPLERSSLPAELTPVENRPPERKPPPPLADERKYFPQLKKF